MTEAERLATYLESDEGLSNTCNDAATLLRSQAAEIERLKSRCAIFKSLRDGQVKHVAEAFAERDALREELEVIKKQKPFGTVVEYRQNMVFHRWGESPYFDNAIGQWVVYTHPAPKQEPVGINGLTESETNATMSVIGLSAPKQEPNEWKEALLDGLAAHATDCPIGTPPREILAQIIAIAVAMATDPAIVYGGCYE